MLNLQLRVSIPAVLVVLLLALVALVAADLITARIEWDRRHDLQRGYAEIGELGCDVGEQCFAPRQPESMSVTFEKVRIRLDMDREGTLPTWFTSIVLAWAAVLILAIAFRSRQVGARAFLAWLFLAVATLFLSADEAISIHENFGGEGSIGSDLNKSLGLDFINFDWVIPAVLAIVLVFPLLIPFFWKLPRSILALFVVAGILYLGGAVGLETYEGNYVKDHAIEGWGYHVLSVIEETLEALGIIVLIGALLLYFRDHLHGATESSRVPGRSPAPAAAVEPAAAAE